MENLYRELLNKTEQEKISGTIYKIADKELLEKVFKIFAPALSSSKSKYPLESVFEVGIHLPTKALVVSNKGATLYCLTPQTHTPCIVRHIGFSVYMPSLGIEFVNVGLSGNIYSNKVVIRSESACTPSFLYGSQRCNCNHQWNEVLELNASFNKTIIPEITNGHEFESWVQKQFSYDGNYHTPSKDGQGFIMMHLDTQNGMGSGYTKDEFSFDLYSRASMRHRGEYSSEQIHQTSMGGGFEAIGLIPDPRGEDDGIGYKITAIVLDYLNTSKELVFLSNNPFKIKYLEEAGYIISRVPFMGEINIAGSQEASERHTEFGHLDISGLPVSSKEDFNKVREAIVKIIKD
jgi:GTP cyclohydrolase II